MIKSFESLSVATCFSNVAIDVSIFSIFSAYILDLILPISLVTENVPPFTLKIGTTLESPSISFKISKHLSFLASYMKDLNIRSRYFTFVRLNIKFKA